MFIFGTFKKHGISEYRLFPAAKREGVEDKKF